MKKLAIIGMGTMGSAIGGLSRGKFAAAGIRRGDSLAAVRDADVVVLAVKPQQFAGLANELREYVGSQMFVSIMAGVRAEQIASILGTKHVVRTMPNLALTTGRSLTAWYAADTTIDLPTLRAILDAWGQSLRLRDETQFDAFTALAGSGPAYFFELARILETAAARHGFTAEQARLIAVQTFLGATSVVDAGTDFAEMVQRVASKGGTTEAALAVLHQADLGRTMFSAVDAAANRSMELGN